MLVRRLKPRRLDNGIARGLIADGQVLEAPVPGKAVGEGSHIIAHGLKVAAHLVGRKRSGIDAQLVEVAVEVAVAVAASAKNDRRARRGPRPPDLRLGDLPSQKARNTSPS